MKTLMILIIVALLAGCDSPKTAEDRAKAAAYCKKFDQPEIVALTSAWQPISLTVAFGCKIPGTFDYTLVPDSVYVYK